MQTDSVFGGVPSYFRARCREASQQLHMSDYADAGYALTSHLSHLVPDSVEEDQWDGEVDELCGLFAAEKTDEALQWFLLRFPKCMALVPPRRRARFIEGAFRCWNEGVEFWMR